MDKRRENDAIKTGVVPRLSQTLRQALLKHTSVKMSHEPQERS